MGTSKRNLSKEIRKLLKDKPLSSINDTAPEITKKILTKKSLKENFDQEDTIIDSIKIINHHFNSLRSNGFKGKSKKELLEDQISQQEFLELILEEIENHGTIASIIEKAYKIVMCKFLEIDEFDTYSFSQLLFYEIVYQLLLGQLHDNIADIFEEVSFESIQQMVNNLARQIMNASVYEKINLFVDKKISLNSVLDEIVSQTSKANFGEF